MARCKRRSFPISIRWHRIQGEEKKVSPAATAAVISSAKQRDGETLADYFFECLDEIIENAPQTKIHSSALDRGFAMSRDWRTRTEPRKRYGGHDRTDDKETCAALR